MVNSLVFPTCVGTNPDFGGGLHALAVQGTKRLAKKGLEGKTVTQKTGMPTSKALRGTHRDLGANDSY